MSAPSQSPRLIRTDARPPDIREIVDGFADSVFGVGEAYGTIGARFGDWIFEITTFRGDVYHPDSRKPAVAFADDITTVRVELEP